MSTDYSAFANTNTADYDELDLNGSIEQESQFIDIPVGDYDGIVDHCEVGKCPWDNPNYNGKNMLTVFINVEADGQETQLRDNIVLVKSMEWKLSQFFLGTGQKKHGEPLQNLSRAIQEAAGLRVRISYVEDKKRTRNDGTPYKNIGKYYEKKATPAASGWNGGGF